MIDLSGCGKERKTFSMKQKKTNAKNIRQKNTNEVVS